MVNTALHMPSVYTRPKVYLIRHKRSQLDQYARFYEKYIERFYKLKENAVYEAYKDRDYDQRGQWPYVMFQECFMRQDFDEVANDVVELMQYLHDHPKVKLLRG